MGGCLSDSKSRAYVRLPTPDLTKLRLTRETQKIWQTAENQLKSWHIKINQHQTENETIPYYRKSDRSNRGILLDELMKLMTQSLIPSYNIMNN